MNWTKEMYYYLSLKVMREVFGSSTDWNKKESEVIDKLGKEFESRLNSKQINFAEHRFRRMKNRYKADLLYSLEKMYWYELHDNYGSLYPPIEYEEKTYDIWTKAVRLKKSVEIVYDSTTSRITKRMIDPYKTITPYGEGFCHLRKDVRKFRFDRIIEIKLTDKSFIKPKDW